MNNDLHSWWTSIPPVTRFLFGMSMALTVGAGFGLLESVQLLLFWPLVISQFQVGPVVCRLRDVMRKSRHHLPSRANIIHHPCINPSIHPSIVH